MRQELSRLGVEETKTPEQVTEAIENTKGTVLVVVNSVCGCAAGGARPGIAMALQNEAKPDKAITVFAGADIDATDTARGYFAPNRPTSPAIGLMKDGELVFMMNRHDIEGRPPQVIAQTLATAFNEHCVKAEAAIN
jgi:putative YphP/YqiW family bacilliredoxin